jgi:CRISP-associated protein Cas1
MLNQAFLLKALAKPRNSAPLLNSSRSIRALEPKIEKLIGKPEHVRKALFGLEGEAARLYFHALKDVVSERYYIGVRSKRPPRDAFNAMLGYGYGILYADVEKACMLAGLDPYLGFLHADRYGKSSLILDLMEPFRQPVVDRAAITMLSKRMIREGDVEKGNEQVYLSSYGTAKLAAAVVKRLSTKTTYKGAKFSYADVINRQAREVVNLLHGKQEHFEAFVQRW